MELSTGPLQRGFQIGRRPGCPSPESSPQRRLLCSVCLIHRGQPNRAGRLVVHACWIRDHATKGAAGETHRAGFLLLFRESQPIWELQRLSHHGLHELTFAYSLQFTTFTFPVRWPSGWTTRRSAQPRLFGIGRELGPSGHPTPPQQYYIQTIT